MLRVLTSFAAFSALAAFGNTANAECDGVTITGDVDVVRTIEKLLRDRGIALAEGDCVTVRAHVEKRGDAFVIGVDKPDSAPLPGRQAPMPGRQAIERTVGELATAATVIESFARDDGDPLLPIRARQPKRVSIVAQPSETPAPPPARSRGIQVFGAVETSLGSDHTAWMGGHIGVCITLGPLCAAARMRYASVVNGEGMWNREMERRSKELLIGLDVPFALGRTTLSPGFAAGMGSMWTRSDDGVTSGETGGLRADVHVTLTVPVTKRWSLDLSTALDLTQETRIESEMPLPDEPLALLRFGIGVRYGGL